MASGNQERINTSKPALAKKKAKPAYENASQITIHSLALQYIEKNQKVVPIAQVFCDIARKFTGNEGSQFTP